MSSVEDAQKQQAQDERAQALQMKYNDYQQTLSDLQSQLSALTSQLQEHIIVEKTLTSIEPKDRANRKCFKLIGGVLADKSVDEVLKILHEEIKEIKAQSSNTEETFNKLKKEMENWMSTNKVKIVKGNQ